MCAKVKPSFEYKGLKEPVIKDCVCILNFQILFTIHCLALRSFSWHFRHFRSGIDVTFHVYCAKKEEKRLRSILNKWADRGHVGNITISEKDTYLRSLLSIQVSFFSFRFICFIYYCVSGIKTKGRFSQPYFSPSGHIWWFSSEANSGRIT